MKNNSCNRIHNYIHKLYAGGMTNVLSSRGIHEHYSPQIFWQWPIPLDIQVSSSAWNNITHSSTSICCITFCFLLYTIACLPLPSQMFSSLNINNHLLIFFLFILSLLSFILLHYFSYISSSLPQIYFFCFSLRHHSLFLLGILFHPPQICKLH